MKKILLIASLVILLQNVANAQTYSILTIPADLKEDADAVVRYEKTEFVQTDINNGTAKHTLVVTVLNEDGRKYANITIPQDKFRELKSFSGAVLDKITGKTTKKISKSDLFTIAYSQDFAADDKYSVCEYKPSSYPYTIKYEYELRYTNGIYAYPWLAPMSGFGVAVEDAEYIITMPKELKLRYKATNIEQKEPTVTTDAKTTSYQWSIKNHKPIQYERYAPRLSTIVPTVVPSPEEFCIEGKCGNMSSWESMGSWNYGLVKDMGNLSAELQAKLNDMVKDCATDKEKVKKLYEYMQSTTRYVNKNMGIGGYEPIAAASVAKSGFGDCKALSNYMKAMLNAVGIPSVYVVISTTEKDLYLDFPSFTQMNHAILMVPLASDSLWLECTSQLLPFAYVHDNIAGHQALLTKESGSAICRVKKQPDVVEEATTMHITLDENGNGKASVNSCYRQNMYDNMLAFIHTMSREEQINYLAESLKLQKVKISDLVLTTKHDEDPMLELKLNLVAERYANKTGNRLFVPLSPLNGNVSLLKNGKRTLDVFIESATPTTDTLFIELPEIYEAESLPQSSTIQSDFGTYSVNVEMDGQTLKVVQSISLKPGTYPAAKAQEFQDFLRKIDKEANRKAVFRQKG